MVILRSGSRRKKEESFTSPSAGKHACHPYENRLKASLRYRFSVMGRHGSLACVAASKGKGEKQANGSLSYNLKKHSMVMGGCSVNVCH